MKSAPEICGDPQEGLFAKEIPYLWSELSARKILSEESTAE
jgi:hypothetical protein